MDHEGVRSRLSALVDGALTASETAQVEAHLDACPVCRAELAELRATVALLRGLDPVQAPEGFAAAVRARLAQLPHRSPPPLWKRARTPLAKGRLSWQTAAVAASVVLVGTFAANLFREVVPPFREPQTALVRKVSPDQLRRGETAPAAVGRPEALRAPAAQAVPALEPGSLRRVVKNAEVEVEVALFDEAARRILTVAEGAGGFVADSSYVLDEGGVRRGTFVLRVPAARFTEVVRQVEALGTVRRRQITGQDVTEEFVDLEARVRNLERQEARLLVLLDRATRISDLMAIEQELARVRGEVERLTGRLRFLSQKVELATVHADVRERPKVPGGGLWEFDRTLDRVRKAFLNTVRQLLRAAELLAVVVASVLPVAALAAVGWGVFRRLGQARWLGRSGRDHVEGP